MSIIQCGISKVARASSERWSNTRNYKYHTNVANVAPMSHFVFVYRYGIVRRVRLSKTSKKNATPIFIRFNHWAPACPFPTRNDFINHTEYAINAFVMIQFGRNDEAIDIFCFTHAINVQDAASNSSSERDLWKIFVASNAELATRFVKHKRTVLSIYMYMYNMLMLMCVRVCHMNIYHVQLCTVSIWIIARIYKIMNSKAAAQIYKKKMGKMYWPLGDCLSGEGGGGGDGGSGSHRTLSPNEI